MQQLILQDELTMCVDVTKSFFKGKKFYDFNHRYSHVCFGGNGHLVQTYLEQSLRNFTSLDVNISQPSASDLDNLTGKAAVFFGVDCTQSDCKSDTLDMLQRYSSYMKENAGCMLMLNVLLPQIPTIPGGVTALAERENNYFLENYCEQTPEISYYLQVEKICRKMVRDEGLSVILLRFSNVFAPDCAHMPGMDLPAIVHEAYKSRKVIITQADLDHIFSVSYIRNAIHSVYLAFFCGVIGHVYNADRETISLAEFKRRIYLTRPDLFGLSQDVGPNVAAQYHALSSLKLFSCGKPAGSQLNAGLKHLVSYITKEDYDTTNNVAFYTGKIRQIQSLEMRILAEIDRICQANGIQYFLAGGTLLGAVRSGSAIPWDDDIDIGMLRDDFEKFRRVCPGCLQEGFSYSGPASGSHYTIHKIRLDGTYFSTKFSGQNVFEDGIFIDCLIYDRTSNIKLFQKIHGFLLTAITTVMLIKWYGVPRRKYHYYFSKLTMPLLKAIPWPVFHWAFDVVAKLYRHKKNARYLVDTVGKKVNDGPLPNEGLEEVVYVDFEGMKAPIPANPVPYLLYAYGPNYMQKPPFSKRSCPHNFSRIDLGRFVFDTHEKRHFRNVDIRGELFESETDA